MLELYQLTILLKGKNDPLWICSLHEKARVALNCSTGAVYLSTQSACHILTGHNDIDAFEMLVLPIAILHGRLLLETDRPKFVNSIYIDDRKMIFFVAMKIARGGHELWVSSMYRITQKKMLKKLKRCRDL